MKSKDLRLIAMRLEQIKVLSGDDLNSKSTEALRYATTNVWNLIHEAEAEERKAELQSFKEFMVAHLKYSSTSEEAFEKFTEIPIKIGFAEREIALENCADAFNAITELLNEYIDEL